MCDPQHPGAGDHACLRVSGLGAALGRVGLPDDCEEDTVLEFFYTGLLVLAFLFIGWFSCYVVYKLYEGQR